MIREDYVSFEIAKLLKEKGFDVSCRAYYDMGALKEDMAVARDWSHSNYIDHTSAPTLQMAMKWLREVYNILIVINGYSLGWYYNIYDTSWNYIGGYKPIFVVDDDVPLKKSVTSSTYEKACEAAIKYCLENLTT